ncbi:MAG: hypothetical protein R6W77_16220 [Trueperaceae bacterium]
MRVALGVVLALHGLVHLWFVVLALGWIEFQPDMGWTGRSWLLTSAIGDAATRTVAAVMLTIAAAAFVVSGVALISQAPWWRPALASAAIVSSAVLIVVWDGGTNMLVQKGVLGLAINFLVLIFAVR